jgi:hypothetical protein
LAKHKNQYILFSVIFIKNIRAWDLILGKKEGEMLERLPDIYIGKLFNRGRISRRLAALSKLPSADKFCVIRVKTCARPSLLKKKSVTTIPQTSWTAAEKALEALNKEAALLGWYFFIPIKLANSVGYSFYRREIVLKTEAVINDLSGFIKNDKKPLLNDQGDIAAKIYLSSCDNNACSSEACYLNCVYINWLYWPEFYVLGMRI